MGRRTTLTKNPRVDFISKRVEEIKGKKANVAALASSAKSQLKQAQKTMEELDRAMLEAYKDELGERKWDDNKSTYTRALHTEEKRLVADMERVLTRCKETMGKVMGAYLEHLEDTAQKPLTFNTPDEDSKLAVVMETKEEYKAIRTLYSDAMIDVDADLATGADPSPTKQAKVEDAKQRYEEMSERLCDDALKYEQIYREELAQRVAAHFTAEQHLLRGVGSAMRDFIPYTRGLTLDWEEMRTTRRANLSAAKRGGFDDDDNGTGGMGSSLPSAGGFGSSDPNSSGSSKRDGMRASSTASSGVGNPFGDMASDISTGASAAAKSAGTAAKNTSKNLASFVASYAPKSAAKAALDKDGLSNVKL